MCDAMKLAPPVGRIDLGMVSGLAAVGRFTTACDCRVEFVQ